MINSIETVEVPSGVITFDHSTCLMKAVWNNGYTETWPKRGYDYYAQVASFRSMVDSEMNNPTEQCEGPAS